LRPNKSLAHETGIISSLIATRGSMTLLTACLVIAAVAAALYVRVDSKSSKAAITVQAAGRGKPYFNFQDGRPMHIDYDGDQNLTAAMQSGHLVEICEHLRAALRVCRLR